MAKHMLRLEVRNQPGILARVAGLFNRRAYNIESFASGQIRDGIYGMTISMDGNDDALDLIKKQLNKLIDVVIVEELIGDSSEKYELTMIRMKKEDRKTSEMQNFLKAYDCKLMDDTGDEMVFRICETTMKTNEIIKGLDGGEGLMINRSGAVVV